MAPGLGEHRAEPPARFGCDVAGSAVRNDALQQHSCGVAVAGLEQRARACEQAPRAAGCVARRSETGGVLEQRGRDDAVSSDAGSCRCSLECPCNVFVR